MDKRTEASQAPVPFPKTPILKTPTHVQGLDDILRGGFPAKRTSLVTGSHGSGKTTMGIEFLYRGALAGEPGIFFGFEESEDAIRENAATMGWDLAAQEKENKFFVMQGQLDADTINGDFSLKPLLAIISGKAKAMGAKRIVLDALDVLFLIYPDYQRVRAELHILSEWLSEEGMTVLITQKPSENTPRMQFQDFFFSMSDCVISMDARINQQVATRRLRVVKYRGSGFERNECPYVITDQGIRLIPISRISLRHKAFGARISSGVLRLDGMLGGGFYRGSCNLLAGEPRTGKTILASTFVQNACKMKDKVFFLSFEESQEAVIHNVAGVNVDLKKYYDSGLLHFQSVIPESMGAEEHLMQIIAETEQFKPQHMVLDALSAVERFGGKQAAFDYMIRLLNFLKERGITLILTNQTSGNDAQLEITGSGVSSLIDTVVFIRYKQEDGELNRTIQVLKSRGSAHSNQIREFVISTSGLDIIDVYVGQSGVMTGTARKIQEAKDDLESRKRNTAVTIKTAEVSRLKALAAAENERRQAELLTAETVLASLQLEVDINQQRVEELNVMRDRNLISQPVKKPSRKKGKPKKGDR